MALIPDGIEKLLPTKILERAYEDVLSKPAKEIGRFAQDLAKTGRLLLAPIQLTAAFQDRFVRVIERIRK